MVSLQAHSTTILGDQVTPVSLYLRLRDRYPNCLLLESADYEPTRGAFSYIGFDPIASFVVREGEIHTRLPGEAPVIEPIKLREQVLEALKGFLAEFEYHSDAGCEALNNGLFGFSSYNAVKYFEDIELFQAGKEFSDVPDLHYQVFRFVAAFNHRNDRLTLIENVPSSERHDPKRTEEVLHLLTKGQYGSFSFRKSGTASSNFTDAEYRAVVQTCQSHIQRGDVFQIVPSRRFAQPYEGDDFPVYRALRSINPSPFLFYFDYGSFRIFGSSPEAQLLVDDGKATLFPIAGTYRRTNDEKRDLLEIEKLRQDTKENAEHVMLVDLARNDLSRHCYPVTVESFKEVQSFSHVIHLTSRVTGKMQKGATAIELFADTFPMGTLSGAPKYRAMELLDRYERGPRGTYGGAIGIFGFDGSCKHAIVIRSFLSKDSVLYSQAGGGVVADSSPQGESQEVKNKLAALQAALAMGEEIE